MRVGFAGLGRMGALMARNLANGGFDVRVWNRSPAKAHALAGAAGVRVASTPADLAQASDVVFTMLADDEASEEVHLGADGLFANGSSCTFFEMGTMSPAHIRDLAERAPSDCTVIDAPVSGATAAADAGKLMVMIGAEASDIDAFEPLFSTMAREWICLGRRGQGAAMKLAVNAMIHGINQNFAEAMVLAEAEGIRTEQALDVIEASAACPPMIRYRRPLYENEAAHDVTFTVALAAKDMRLFRALCAEHGLCDPVAEATFTQLEAAQGAGFAERDMAAMLAFMREERG